MVLMFTLTRSRNSETSFGRRHKCVRGSGKLDVEPTIDMKKLHAKIRDPSMSRQAILLEISHATGSTHISSVETAGQVVRFV